MKNPTTICLGAVKLGMPDYGFSSADNTEGFKPLNFLKQVEEAGIYRFDTSPRYGESEKILGQYIAQSKVTLFVSSKIDSLKPNDSNTPKIMFESVKDSLTKLNLARLDICYLHQNDLEIISDSHVHEGLSLLKQQGLIQHTGASLYSHQECEYALSSEVFDFIQVPVNVFDVSFYNNFIKDNKTSVRFVARSLLLQGILVNRAKIREHIAQADQILSYLEKLDKLAEQYNISTFEMALALVFSLDKIDHYIIGTTDIKHLKDAIECLSHKLSKELVEDLTDLTMVSKDWANPKNWKKISSHGKV